MMRSTRRRAAEPALADEWRLTVCILETERLLLRRFTLDDLDEICRLVYAGPVVKDAWSGATGPPEEIKARFSQRYILPGGDFGLRASR